MSLPPILFRSTYRSMMKHTTRVDRSPAYRALLSGLPRQMFVREINSWMDTETPREWDASRRLINDFILTANMGASLYLPPLPGATAGTSEHTSLSAAVRQLYRSRPATSASLSEAFSAIKALNSYRETFAKMVPKVPELPPFPEGTTAPDYTKLKAVETYEDAHGPADRSARFLVAHPVLPDIFGMSIVLMADSVGFVVNRPAVSARTQEYLQVWAAMPKEAHPIFSKYLANNVLFIGGPVQGYGSPERTFFVLHTLPGVDESAIVAPGVFLASDRKGLDALLAAMEATHADPKRMMVLLGYAGWGQGQLEGEVRDHSWMVLRRDVDPDDAADVADLQRFVLLSNIVIEPKASATQLRRPRGVVSDPELSWCRVVSTISEAHRDLTRLAAPKVQSDEDTVTRDTAAEEEVEPDLDPSIFRVEVVATSEAEDEDDDDDDDDDKKKK